MMDHRDAPELLLCDSAWCTVAFEADEGFGGRCPECLATAGEHLAGAHVEHVDRCLECARASSLGAARARVQRSHAA